MSAVEASVAGVVLAAGSSTRMGRNKMLLDLGGETMIRRAVRQAVEAGLDPVVVVLGHEAERVREELAGLACVPVLNPEHARGAGASLRVGVRAVRDAVAFVLLLADMPFVTKPMLASLLARYREGGTRLVMSRYGDVEAPPHLFERSLYGELLAGPDERCAKPVILRHMQEATVTAWPASALQDVDVTPDYERVRAQLAGA
jgi:molybdenum cofactor cytidylyltransferase